MSCTEAELISTGAELLSGRSVNTHARDLGECLGRFGIRLTRDTTVGDDIETIQSAVRDAAQRVSLVFITGGLGPTNDDVTRDALARLVGQKIVMDKASLERLRERMRIANRPMTPARERQALVLSGARVLPNSAGAAPGEHVQAKGIDYFLLPGPPTEFRTILEEHIVPWLADQSKQGAGPLRERILLVHGLGEGDIVDRLEKANFPPAGIVTAYCAGAGRVEVRLHPTADTDDIALDQATDQAAALLGDSVYARQRVSLPQLVGQALLAAQATVATAESCTGGLIGAQLTHIAGSSAYFKGGIIAYADDVKEHQLSVEPSLLAEHGAVSEPVARAMAVGARQQLQADYAIAVTGIAGPGGGTKDKPVGLVYTAIATPDAVHVVRDIFPGNRETIREATCRNALMRLLRHLPAVR